jgi:hypothetical protein
VGQVQGAPQRSQVASWLGSWHTGHELLQRWRLARDPHRRILAAQLKEHSSRETGPQRAASVRGRVRGVRTWTPAVASAYTMKASSNCQGRTG